MARNKDITFDDAMKVVNELAREIKHHRHGLNRVQVLKAGSLGQYTAIPGNFDVDLVVYSESVDPDMVLREGYTLPLHKLRSFLGGLRSVQLQPPQKMSLSLKYKTFDQQDRELSIDVDVLVSPNWENPADLYNYLTTAKHNGATSTQLFWFSVNASKWQVEFIEKQDDKAKELIRRAKAWRNKEWPEETYCTGRPKSHLISILVLRAYELGLKQQYGAATIEQRTTANLKQIVKSHLTANIYWSDFYNPVDYSDLFPAKLPRIVDPANPANDLHNTGFIGGSTYTSHSYYEQGDGNWTQLVGKIVSVNLTKTIEQIQA